MKKDEMRKLEKMRCEKAYRDGLAGKKLSYDIDLKGAYPLSMALVSDTDWKKEEPSRPAGPAMA